MQKRKGQDGAEHEVISSLDGGGAEAEGRTGILASEAFTAPAVISFWLWGHRGFPGEEAHGKNLVRLVDAADGTVYRTAFPPRSDVGVAVEWKEHGAEGKKVRLEVVDGDKGTAYAWLAVGHFGKGLPNEEGFSLAAGRGHALAFLAEFLVPTAPVLLREKLLKWMPEQGPAPQEAVVGPEERARLDGVVAERLQEWEREKGDAVKGEAVFAAYCSVCHQTGGKGQLVGPQLDGISQRGAARLCEDILDPHRNVDAHFRVHQLTMKDGSAKSGMIRGRRGATLLLVDAGGQEARVPEGDIAGQKETALSLMPAGLGEGIPQGDFRNLLAYLLGR
jgi:putative heme-binding domain-containing protein